MREVWVVGDVHGALHKLRSLLVRAGLLDLQGNWAGEDAQLVFLGDYVDRGPDGAGVVQLIRHLEAQAPASGGQVSALLGNHEVMLLAALTFASLDPQDRLGYRDYWLGNGGQPADLDRLSAEDLAWIRGRPVILPLAPWLMVHTDTPFYLRLGGTAGQVNAAVRALLARRNPEEWGVFLNSFTGRLVYAGSGGTRAARSMLGTFGGEVIVHGHTPIYLLSEATAELGSAASSASAGVPPEPILYAGGLCLDVDSGMAYRDDAGFVARLDPLQPGALAEVLSHAERLTAAG